MEIVILHILFEDIYKIDDTLQQFMRDCPNAYSQDEYIIASNLNEALKKQDYPEMVKICRQPLFSFLETELVKHIKRLVANPPVKPTMASDQPQSKPEDVRKQALDSLI